MRLRYFSASFALHRERPNAKTPIATHLPSLLPRSRQLISGLTAGEQGRVSLADQSNSTQPLSLRPPILTASSHIYTISRYKPER
jgi:hypothetical protein